MVKKRSRHAAAYKSRVALEALEVSKTISQLSREHEIHSNHSRTVRKPACTGASLPTSADLGMHRGRVLPSPPVPIAR